MPRAGLQTVVAGAFGLLGACATAPPSGAGSVAEHDQMATANEELARGHAGKASDAAPCADVPGVYEVCWTRDDTPQAHDDMATRHRELAAEHRGAAEALRRAEAEACGELAESDRDISPFLRWRDIARTELLEVGDGATESEIPVARITFAVVPHLEVSTLQRVVDCHLARNAALGHDVPEMEYCPLVPPGTHATVAMVDGRVAVTVTTSESSYGEVRRRAQQLADKT